MADWKPANPPITEPNPGGSAPPTAVRPARLWLIFGGVVLLVVTLVAAVAIRENIRLGAPRFTQHQVSAWLEVLSTWPQEPPATLAEAAQICDEERRSGAAPSERREDGASGAKPRASRACTRLNFGPLDRDAWDRPLRYRPATASNPVFEVRSDGADGAAGTADDIWVQGRAGAD